MLFLINKDYVITLIIKVKYAQYLKSEKQKSKNKIIHGPTVGDTTIINIRPNLFCHTHCFQLAK